MAQKSGNSGVFWFWVVMAVIWFAAYKGCSAVGDKVELKDWWETHVECRYKNAVGDCLTEDAHFKLLAHDAAIDAITETLQYCAGAYFGNQFDPRCGALKQAILQSH